VGLTQDELAQGLTQRAKYDVPTNVLTDMTEWHSAYGKLILEQEPGSTLLKGELRLTVTDPIILERVFHDRSLERFWLRRDQGSLLVDAIERGNLKQALIKVGYPVKDLCGYLIGDPLEITLRAVDLDGNPFSLRDYQEDAAEAFYHAGRATGGSGVIVFCWPRPISLKIRSVNSRARSKRSSPSPSPPTRC